jgi:nitrite reductase/ring-hydroxylating ferredoxin subunit
VINQGGRIFTGTHVQEIDDKGVTSRDGYRVNAKHIVVATNSPVNNKYLMHLRQFPYRTYVIGACVKKGAVADALYWDTGDQNGDSAFAAYHYVRTEPYNKEFDLVICGGEDHPTGLVETSSPPDERSKYLALSKWLRERFPIEDVVYECSGQVIYAFDALVHIGRNPMDKDNIYIVTGECGNGLTYGAISGMLIPDLINEKENEYEELYRPSRFKFLQAGKVFLDELFSGLAAYYKTKNSDKVDSFEEIQKGEGKIMEINGKKYGASRGYDNSIDIVASECTHLGCIVKWNTDEQSWDCACHGSRFTNTGIVINGPANYNLNHLKLSKQNSQHSKQL